MRGLFAALALLVGAGPAAGTDESSEELMRRLDAVEARLAVLEASTPDGFLTERRAEEVRRLVGELLDDADRRAALQDRTGWAGYDRDFAIQSADGNYRLEVGGQLQVRFLANHREELGTLSGFEVRRAKVDVRGHVVTPDFRYRVTVARRAIGFTLQTATIQYRPTDEISLQAGRFRPPLLREEEVSSRRQLLVERSLVARTFNQRRSTGFTGRFEDDNVRVTAGLFDPARELDFQGWLASARALVRLWGDLDELNDFVSFPDDEPTAGLGLGIGFADLNLLDPTEPVQRFWRWTVDLSIEFGGANVMVAFVGNHPKEAGQPTMDQYGLVVQGGVCVSKTWEIISRYQWGDADQEAPDLSIVSIGFNKYVDAHDLKFTLDFGYSFGEIDGFWSSRNAGWLADAPGQTGQMLLRVQTQMLF